MNNKAVNNKADRYIEDVLRRVVLPSARKDDLRADLREHFAAAEEGREPVEEVIQRLGEPEEVAASFMEGVELRFAGIWPRFVALCADVGFCSLGAIPAVTFGYALSSAVNNDAAPFYSFSLFCVFAFFCLATFGVFLLYFPILEHFFGWTLGKKLMKIRVVSEQGGPVSGDSSFTFLLRADLARRNLCALYREKAESLRHRCQNRGGARARYGSNVLSLFAVSDSMDHYSQFYLPLHGHRSCVLKSFATMGPPGESRLADWVDREFS